MKYFIALAVFAVVFGSSQAQLPMIGKCTFTNFTMRSRDCNTDFIQAMMKNPNSNCSVELNGMWDCSSKAIMNCVPLANEAVLKMMMKSMMTKQMMCDKAGVQYPGSMGNNASLPCKLTEQEYLNKINGCSDKMMSIWGKNRADTALCGEYLKSKDCVRDVLKNNCDFSKIEWFDELVKLSLGNYNPFCANNVDPTPSPRAGAHVTSLNGLLVLFVAVLSLLFV